MSERLEADSLEELEQLLEGCQRCPLWSDRSNLVFGSGSRDAQLMFIGEAPGRAEDAKGLPFVGPAGRLLDDLLAGIGLTRSEVYITNVVKCRPPGNRDPLPEEMEACHPFLARQIELIEPKIVCALGRVAAGSLLGKTVQMSRIHGTRLNGDGYFVVPVFHPAAALRTPSSMSALEEDFRNLKKYLQQEEVAPKTVSREEPEQLELF
ncbi:MAG: uracil-DNA glycosylase [Actinomycetota bacterium]|nr:uracil-DNA glycosylase [Actinomycetota bacterium]